MKHISLVIAVLFATTQGLSAQDFKYTTYHFNPVMDPKGPRDVLVDCAKNAACYKALEMGLQYFGVRPEVTAGAKTMLEQSYKREGEETRLNLHPAHGWSYCRVAIRTTSVVPKTGDRATAVSFNASSDRIGIYAWTPKRGLGRGRTWYDGVLSIELVRTRALSSLKDSGRCTVPISWQDQNRIDCRGGSGVNKGTPACKNYDF